jgi:Zn-dependent peptidase ImmA (M78 family)
VGPRRGLWQRDEHGEVIVLDAGLDRRARRCVLAHELVHAERGIGHPAATVATMEREEEAVRREVARRLVPPDLLASYLDSRADLGGVLATEVADEFDVEVDVAAKALELLDRDLSRPTPPGTPG